jgi:hypothetical protein
VSLVRAFYVKLLFCGTSFSVAILPKPLTAARSVCFLQPHTLKVVRRAFGIRTARHAACCDYCPVWAWAVYWDYRKWSLVAISAEDNCGNGMLFVFAQDCYRERLLTKDEEKIRDADVYTFSKLLKSFAPAILKETITRYDGRFARVLQLKGGVGKPLTTPLPDYVSVATFSSARKKGVRLSGEKASLVHRAAVGVRQASPINIYTGKGIIIEGEMVIRKTGKEKTSI